MDDSLARYTSEADILPGILAAKLDKSCVKSLI